MPRIALHRLEALAAACCCLLAQTRCESRKLTLGRLPDNASAGMAGASTTAGGTVAATTAGEGPGGEAGLGGSEATGSGGSAGTTTGASEAPRFGPAELVSAVAADSEDANDENPTLTSSLLELYFTSTRDGGLGAEDVWVARRNSVDDDFNPPEAVTTVNTDNPDSSPSISLDGQTLWIGVEREDGLGGRDIWRFGRSDEAQSLFGAPVLEANVNSTEDEIPRPLGNHGLTMPLSSRRGGTVYTTYLATRDSTSDAFGTPVVVGELVLEGYKTTDAFLTEDGLALYFVRGLDDKTGDLYVAFRSTTSAPFGAPVPLSTVNQDASDERDPWLSPDGGTLFFVSDRDGPRRIYRASRSP